MKLTSNERDFLFNAGIACILRFLELLGKVPHLLFHFFKGFNLWNKFIKLAIFSCEQLGLRSNLVLEFLDFLIFLISNFINNICFGLLKILI